MEHTRGILKRREIPDSTGSPLISNAVGKPCVGFTPRAPPMLHSVKRSSRADPQSITPKLGEVSKP